MADQENEDFESENTYQNEEDEIEEWTLEEAIEPYFCFDRPGDVDSIDFDNDEDYNNHPLYQEKYGKFDRMMELFYKASSWHGEKAETCIKAYMTYTRPEDVSTAALCHYLFNSHLARHPELEENEKPRFRGDETPLTQEDGIILNELLATYDFGNLTAEASVIEIIYDTPKTFAAENFTPEALELVRIQHVAIVEEDLPYIKEQATKLDRQVQAFAVASLDMLSQVGDSPNPQLYARTWELVDEVLDIYSPQLALKEEKRQLQLAKRRQKYREAKEQAKLSSNSPSTQASQNRGPRPQ